MAGISLSGSKLMDKNAIEYSGNYQNLQPFYGITPTNVKFYTVPQGGSFSTRWISKLDDNKGIFKMNFSRSFNKSGVEINNPSVPGTKLNFGVQNENTYFNTSFKYWANEKLKYFTAFSYSNNTDNIKINEGTNNQKLILFNLGKAMSGAPIMSGTNQLPNAPTVAGITILKKSI